MNSETTDRPEKKKKKKKKKPQSLSASNDSTFEHNYHLKVWLYYMWKHKIYAILMIASYQYYQNLQIKLTRTGHNHEVQHLQKHRKKKRWGTRHCQIDTALVQYLTCEQRRPKTVEGNCLVTPYNGQQRHYSVCLSVCLSPSLYIYLSLSLSVCMCVCMCVCVCVKLITLDRNVHFDAAQITNMCSVHVGPILFSCLSCSSHFLLYNAIVYVLYFDRF